MTQITYITSVDGTYADIKRSPSGFISAYVPIGRDVSNTYVYLLAAGIQNIVLCGAHDRSACDSSFNTFRSRGILNLPQINPWPFLFLILHGRLDCASFTEEVIFMQIRAVSVSCMTEPGGSCSCCSAFTILDCIVTSTHSNVCLLALPTKYTVSPPCSHTRVN